METPFENLIDGEVYRTYEREAGMLARLPFYYARAKVDPSSPQHSPLVKVLHEICSHSFHVYTHTGPCWIWYLNHLSNMYYLNILEGARNKEVSAQQIVWSETLLKSYFEVLKGPLEALGTLETLFVIDKLIMGYALSGEMVAATHIADGILKSKARRTPQFLREVKKLGRTDFSPKGFKEIIIELINLADEVKQAALRDEKTKDFFSALRDLYPRRMLSETLSTYTETIAKKHGLSKIISVLEKFDKKERKTYIKLLDFLRSISTSTLNLPLAVSPEDFNSDEYNATLRLERILKILGHNEVQLNSWSQVKRRLQKKIKWSDGLMDYDRIYRSRVGVAKTLRPILSEHKNRRRIYKNELTRQRRQLKDLPGLLPLGTFSARWIAFSPIFDLSFFPLRKYHLGIRNDIVENSRKENFWMLNLFLTTTRLSKDTACPLRALQGQVSSDEQDARVGAFAPYALTKTSQKCQELCSEKTCAMNIGKCKQFRKILLTLYADS